MSDKTGIEWTDATWNPVTGCTKVSPGCDHCYAETFAERWRGTPGHHFENGFDVTLRPERLDQPIRWKRPRRIFVNSMSDLFHEAIPDEFIWQVFDVMEQAKHHTFQVLTKRHGRMRSFVQRRMATRVEYANSFAFCPTEAMRNSPAAAFARERATRPPSNIWLGVSVEDQKRADLRIPALLQTPAVVRFISAEPLLGPVDLSRWLGVEYMESFEGYGHELLAAAAGKVGPAGGLHWVIAGGESGHSARPMHQTWARQLRDQCQAAGSAFLFKQWGEWAPTGRVGIGNTDPRTRLVGQPDGRGFREEIRRVGKKAAGRELDGRTWDEYPGGAL